VSIKVGDLAQTIFPAKCGCLTNIGHIFTVVEIREHNAYCPQCLKDLSKYVLAKSDHGIWFGVHRLKRIPPLDELEREQERKEITA
jgi:hypothetical protein